MEEAHVRYNPAQTDLGALIATVRNSGYRVGGADLRVRIEGMHCASCVTRLEEALQAVPGVLEATVNPATGTAQIRYLPRHGRLRPHPVCWPYR